MKMIQYFYMKKVTILPDEIKKYFWGDDLQKLNWKTHKEYISRKILEEGDQKATKWLLAKIDKKTIRSLLPKLKLSKKSANFWSIYLS